MLRKLSLIFIRFTPLLLALNVLLKIAFYYYTISPTVINCVGIVTKVIILIGFIILSLTFKFCVYHRVLIYCVLICYLLCLANSVLGVNFFITTLIYFFAGATILSVVCVIYVYLKQK